MPMLEWPVALSGVRFCEPLPPSFLSSTPAKADLRVKLWNDSTFPAPFSSIICGLFTTLAARQNCLVGDVSSRFNDENLVLITRVNSKRKHKTQLEPEAMTSDKTVVIPLHFERAVAEKRRRVTGRVSVSTVLREHEELVEQTLA